MKPSGAPSSVVAAAIVGILISLFTILGTLAAIAGFAMLPRADATVVPPFARSMLIAIMGLIAGLAIFGIFTCVGVLRLKKWARISMLIWGGVIAAFSSIMLLFTSFVPLPDMYARDTAVSPQYIRIVMAVIYGTQFLIGVWWLLLFNQRAVKERFLTVPAGDGQILAAPQPRCPLPLALLAGFSIFSAGFSLFLPFTNFPVNMILFGNRLHGPIGLALFYLSAGLLIGGAVGLLRLKRWSYPLVLAQYFFWMASGTVTLVRPNYDRNLQEIVSQMNLPEGPMGQAAFAQTRVFGVLSLIPGVLLIWLLLYCHTRFVEACSAKEAQRNT
jgi:hypothetical protein